MSLASTLTDAKARLDALLTYANSKTGKSDVSIGDAIKTLTDGFGGGGGETYHGTVIASTSQRLVLPIDIRGKVATICVCKYDRTKASTNNYYVLAMIDDKNHLSIGDLTSTDMIGCYLSVRGETTSQSGGITTKKTRSVDVTNNCYFIGENEFAFGGGSYGLFGVNEIVEYWVVLDGGSGGSELDQYKVTDIAVPNDVALLVDLYPLLESTIKEGTTTEFDVNYMFLFDFKNSDVTRYVNGFITSGFGFFTANSTVSGTINFPYKRNNTAGSVGIYNSTIAYDNPTIANRYLGLSAGSTITVYKLPMTRGLL